MPLIIQCPQCSARYRIDPGPTAGPSLRLKCPKCSAVFAVQVPVPAAPPMAEAAPSAVAAAPPPAAAALSEAILVVDDSRFFRELILDLLKPLEIPCLTAATAEEALELVERDRPRLILLDLNLPGKNGYELIREIRAQAELKDVRILAMSGVFRKESDVAEAEVAGADDFINKSFKPEQLQARIRRLYVRS